MNIALRTFALFALAAFAALPVIAGPAFEPLTGFEAGPLSPGVGDLLLHADGNFYGTSQGGTTGFGTIYKVTPAGVISTFATFTGVTGAAKGRTPTGKLASDGTSFLGVTQAGGTGNLGTVFKVNAVTGAVTTVAEFTGTAGSAKGQFPIAGLTAVGGSFWGTTQSGGATNRGTVFRVNVTTGVLTTVVEFTGTSGAAKGSAPYAALMSDGTNLWGTASGGGAGNFGTIFKINASTGVLTTVAEFTGTTGTAKGRTPYGALVSDGLSFWGTTSAGGAGDLGTVYKVNASTGVITTVVEFTGTTGPFAGSVPKSSLVSDGANFWGTTEQGGSIGYGTVFKINAATGALTTVLSFADGFDGGRPDSGFTSDGVSFWGTNTFGGERNLGTIYKMNIGTGVMTTVAAFTGTATKAAPAEPYSALVSDGANFWGTTRKGGVGGSGTVFKLNPNTGSVTTVVQMGSSFIDPSLYDAGYPYAGLVSDGTSFWGTVSEGGQGNRGAVFKVNAASGVRNEVAWFSGTLEPSKGYKPIGTLVSDGTSFWGTTANGGALDLGTVFKVNASTGVITTLAEFTGATGPLRGSFPTGALVRSGDSYWGTAGSGGAGGFGTVFKVHATTGVLTTVLDFTGTSGAARGSASYSGFVSDGTNLWGTTSGGGAGNFGTIFKIDTVTGVLTTVVELTGNTGLAKGRYPYAGLVSDGTNFWGTTYAGGASSFGTVFKVSPGGVFATVFEFTDRGGGVPGAYPGYGSLLRHTDGHLYGTTTSGGVTTAGLPAGNGQIFRIRLGPTAETQNATLTTINSTTLHGMVNPNGQGITTVAFEYGTSPILAGAATISAGTVADGNVAAPVSAALAALAPGTTYYYRTLATNAGNRVAQQGQILSVTTLLSPFQEWKLANLGDANAPSLGDGDGDGLNNLQEYAFGTNPNVGDAVPLEFSGAVLTRPGMPVTSVASTEFGVDFALVFCRRKGLANGTLTYTVQFSADLLAWENSAATPSALADDGVIEAVRVPYPFFLSNGRKAQFARVAVTGQ